MPDVLHLKPEEIDTKEKRRRYTVSVIGCEKKGVFYAMAFAEVGFKVICTDTDQTLVKRLAKGKTMFHDREIESKLKSFMRRGHLSVTSELRNAVSQSDIVVMTLTAKIDGKQHADYLDVENACKQVGTSIRRDTLFVYGGVAGLGFTEGVVKETLENTSGLRVGEDIGLVYSLIHLRDEQPLDSITGQELKVAAADRTSLDSAVSVLGAITGKSVKSILDVKTAEAALLFTIAKQDANLALANELAVFCESADIDYLKTLKLVDAQETSFSPKVEVAEDSGREAYLLLESGENLNSKLRLPALARKINEDMVKHAIKLTRNALRSCGKTLRRAKVTVLGSEKPTTMLFAKMLEKKGAKVSLYDSLLPKTDRANMARIFKRNLKEAVEGADCVVILTKKDRIKRLNLKKLRA
ncbi:MAG: UDP binding domain-containing protein, partial [Candidatus Bathyarchaeia archaeon]|nr:UDP binding domain-containing protein [Candidatus Bathyarchaeia archaeon]